MLYRTMVLLWVGFVLASPAWGEESAQPKHYPPKFFFVAEDEQFIAAPDAKIAELLASPTWVVAAPVSRAEQTLLAWPAKELLRPISECVNRAKEFPPLNGAPGADSPAYAAHEAEGWIQMIIRPEWIPYGVTEGFRAVQAEDPSQSRIVCRWSVADGNSIQVTQTAATVCVVIRPNEDLRGSAPIVGFSSLLVEQFLCHDREMLDRSIKPLGRSPDGKMHVFVPKLPPSSTQIEGRAPAYSSWWGWYICYTDGSAVAYYFPKKLFIRKRTPISGDRWF